MSRVHAGDRIVVTGATGFVGQTVVEHLSDSGYRVVGVSERCDVPARIASRLDDYYSFDLTRGWPDVGPFGGLVHLAGLAAVGPSFERPQEYINVNSTIATQLFEEALRSDWSARIIVVSSGAVYDNIEPGGALTEDSPLSSTSPYVVSKLLVENQTAYYARRGIDTLVARPFNHIGPGQLPGFIVPDLTAKMLKLQPGGVLTVGNLDSARDYTDVRDVARAYGSLLELDEPRHSTYNVCSGTARSGWTLLNLICASLGAPVPATEVASGRAIDPPVIEGSARRLSAETGWVPTIDLETSIDDFVSAIKDFGDMSGTHCH